MDEVSARITANAARRKAEAEAAAAKAAGGGPAPEGPSFNDQYNFDVMFPRVGERVREGAPPTCSNAVRLNAFRGA